MRQPWIVISLAGLLVSACWLDGSADAPTRSAEQAAAYVGDMLGMQHAGSTAAVAARVGYWEGTLQLGPRTARVSAVSNLQGQVLLREVGGVSAWWLTDLTLQGAHVVGTLRNGGDSAHPRGPVRFFGSAEPGRLDGALRTTAWSLSDVLADREPATEAEALRFGHLRLERRTAPAAIDALPSGMVASDSATQTALHVDANGNLEGAVLGCTVRGAIRLSPSVGGVAELAAQTSGAMVCFGLQRVTGSAVAQSDGTLDVMLTDGTGAFALRLPAR
jgi:hypothetical protein